MVEDHVHDNLQSLRVGLVAETLVVLVGTKAGIHLVIIGSGIAMIGGEAIVCVGGVVLKYGREPEGGHTEFLEVVEVLADTVEVTAMTE